MIELDIEPSDEQLTLVEAELDKEVEPVSKLDFNDKLLMMENGQVLLTRLVTNVDDDGRNMLYVYRPYEVVNDEYGTCYLRKWIPESDDFYYCIPQHRVLTICEPGKEILQAYHEGIQATDVTYRPSGTVLH